MKLVSPLGSRSDVQQQRRKASALNEFGVFFGFGALLLPFSLGALESAFGVTALLDIAAGFCLLLAVAAAALPFPSPKQLQGWPLAEMSAFLRMPVVVALAALLFFESGNEFALGGYVSSFLTRELHVTPRATSYSLAAFWAAIMLSRIGLSRLLLRVSASTVVLACALLSAAGALVIASAAAPAHAIAGTALTGFALGGIFPTVLSLAGARFPERSGTVFGILFTVALAGGMTMPWLAGHLAEWSGIRAVFVLAAASFVAVAVLSIIARRAA